MKNLANLCVCLCASCICAATAATGTIDLESPAGRISFDERNGGVVALVPAGGGVSVWRSDPGTGLWMTKDKAGHLEKAADFSSAADAARRFSHERRGDALALRYEAAAYSVEVAVVPTACGFELRGRVVAGESLASPITDFWLPAKFRFSPDETEDLVFPMVGMHGVGVAYNGKWFADQSALPPLGETNVWKRFNFFRVPYPAAFSDFMHLKRKDGAGCAVYGIQPRPAHEPWRPKEMLVPAALEAGGDANGGFAAHSFAAWVREGKSWATPAVALDVSTDFRDALFRYASANRVCQKPFSAKMPPRTAETLKYAPMVNIKGSARQQMSILDKLPMPSLLHLPEYMKGGFDKQYPDFLPPNSDYGTEEDFRAFIDAAHARGHLVMPYTNPTFWCDNPRGETFLAEGEAPLLVMADGKHHYEHYGKNDGWTPCLWHPAVRKANAKIMGQFTHDFPVDVLFQDQVGARSWFRDFNPASPAPWAYSEAMLEMNAEDASNIALATEGGWDRVVDNEAALCGMTFWIVPRSGGACTDAKKQWRPDTWRIEPLAAYLAHDKSLFFLHNLGHFTIPQDIRAAAVALGFSMSTIVSVREGHYNDFDKWLGWNEPVFATQRDVVARYALKPLTAFRHDFGPALDSGADPLGNDNGIVVAEYGDVKVVANLGPVARAVDGVELEPFGYRVVSTQ